MSGTGSPRRFTMAWWNLGRRPTPWLHAGLAFLVGAVLYAIAQFALVGLLLVGPSIALGFTSLGLVVSGLAFGALGVAFLGRNGAWLASTAVAWAVGCILAFGLGISSTDGQLDQGLWFPPLLSGIAPFAIALIAHRGPTRTLSLLVIAASVVVGLVVLSIDGYQQHLAEGRRRFGPNVHPEVTSVDRTQRAQVQAFPGSETTVGPYLTADPEPDGTFPIVFTLLTEPDRGPACGSVLYGATGTEAEVSKAELPGGSIRWIVRVVTLGPPAALLIGHCSAGHGARS